MVNLPFLSRLDRSYAFRQILTFVLAFVDATREKFEKMEIFQIFHLEMEKKHPVRACNREKRARLLTM